MHVIHPEDMVCRSKDHLRTVGKDHRLKYIHDLGDVRHLQTGSMAIEDVKAHGSDHGVAHGVLLEEVARVGARLYVEPCSPLVEKKADSALRIISVHDGLMILEHLVDLD